MAKRSGGILLSGLTLGHDAARPVYRQLCDQLRDRILSGRLAPRTRLPSSRILARELAVSRNTVMAAYEHLAAEGYLEGAVGSGTRVAADLPLAFARPDRLEDADDAPSPEAKSLRLSPRGQWLAALPFGPSPPSHQAFSPSLPALDAFPYETWRRIARRVDRREAPGLYDYGDPAGLPALREAIAGYLAGARGVRADAEQVIVVTDSQQAIVLAAQLLAEPGDKAWIEDPGYLGARGGLHAAGLELVPIPVDLEGIDIGAGVAAAPGARLAYVSPSHQYPLGVTLSLPRRLALLDWAKAADAWIIEDDYNSEYRYDGRPLTALQGLDAGERVVYVGSFSKVLFPSLRLSYLVVPKRHAKAFRHVRRLLGGVPSSLAQAVLAAFIEEGHFGAHVRRMRQLYALRQGTLIAEAAARVPALEMMPSGSGMHLMAWLPDGVDDVTVARRALAAGVTAPALSSYRLRAEGPGGLLLGYAGFSQPEMVAGLDRLAGAIP